MSNQKSPNIGPWSSQTALLQQLASSYGGISPVQFEQQSDIVDDEFVQAVWQLPAGLSWWRSTTEAQKQPHLQWSIFETERRLWLRLLGHHNIPYPIFGIYPQAPFAGWPNARAAIGMQDMSSVSPIVKQEEFDPEEGSRASPAIFEGSRASYVPLSLTTNAAAPRPALPIIETEPEDREATHAPNQQLSHWPLLSSTGTILHSVILPRGILPYITGPASHPHSLLLPIETEFECGVQWANTTSPTTITLWAQPRTHGSPADVGVRYCARFLRLYRLEVTAVREAGRKGPWIDEFLRTHLERLHSESTVPEAQGFVGPSRAMPAPADGLTMRSAQPELRRETNWSVRRGRWGRGR